MKTVVNQRAFSFAVNLEPPADADSVTWTLRNGQGSPMIGATDVPVQCAAGATSVVIAISSALNTMAVGSTAESRFLDVQWTVAGATYTTSVHYLLSPWLPIRAQPEDVISAIGLNTAEITPDEVDILGAALFVQQDVTPAIFTPALTSNDINTLRVNQCIVLKAATELASSLPMRAAAAMKSDTSSFQRMKMEVTKYVDYLWQQYSRYRNDLVGPAQGVTQTVMALGAPATTMYLGGLGPIRYGPRYQMGTGPLFGGNLLPLIMSPGLGNSF